MDRFTWVLCLVAVSSCYGRQVSDVRPRLQCDRTKMSLEVGEWSHSLRHIDSAAIENPPVSVSEGQIYFYENYFPNMTIKYIHVDNFAVRTCGASASIKSGGVDTPGVLVVLQSAPHQEIRSIIDIWGVKNKAQRPRQKATIAPEQRKMLHSRYLFSGMRAVSHNQRKT